MYRQPNTSASTYPSDNRWSSQSQQAPLFFSPRKRSPNNSDSDSDTKGPALLARTIMEHNKNINSNHRPQAVAKKPTAEIWWAWLRKLLKDIITFPLLLLSGYIILGIMFGIAVYTLGCEQITPTTFSLCCVVALFYFAVDRCCVGGWCVSYRLRWRGWLIGRLRGREERENRGREKRERNIKKSGDGWLVMNGADADFWVCGHIVLIMAGKYGKCRLSHSEWYCSRQLGGFWDR